MALVEMELARILISETSESQVIYLKEKGGQRGFPILIGIYEAFEINRKITGEAMPRPMTHDLLRNTIRSLGAGLERVVIDALREATFFAKLQLKRGSETVMVDCRPSDAIALAAAEQAPIFVDESVIDEATKTE